MVYKVLWHNMLPIKPGTQGRIPSLFDNVHWVLLLANTQHTLTGPTAYQVVYGLIGAYL